MLFRTALGLFLGTTVVYQESSAWTVPIPSTRRVTTTTALSSSNNIVLRPSEGTSAFDSYRIGNARVHRYIRDSDVDAQAEYVMWYHGRPHGFDLDQELPPLSTGRIGRATSRNGLVWEKAVEGSQSEDAPDVSLGLNKESWWGFDTAHVGLGQVLLPMSTPAIMTDGGVYLMYYMGGNFEESPITNYIENAAIVDNPAMANAKIKGMQLKIGVAVSQDGISWGRVEGDDPTGACMAPYDSADPNMQGIMRDDDDSRLTIDEELYCGWPEVVVNTASDDEIVLGKKKPGFFMYYSTMKKSDKQKCLGFAVSPDGFRWTKRGICLEPDATGLDAGGCARCNVITKATFNEATRVWNEGEGYIMFYEGVSKEDNKHRILKAESTDGRTWRKLGLALDVGESEEDWDCIGVGSPHVLRLDDGSMRMYYTGQGADGSTAIGVAKIDTVTGEWAREQVTFLLA